eukprot:m51a1_g13652 hypothetical protein (126) ;mRNA; r:1028-1607
MATSACWGPLPAGRSSSHCARHPGTAVRCSGPSLCAIAAADVLQRVQPVAFLGGVLLSGLALEPPLTEMSLRHYYIPSPMSCTLNCSMWTPAQATEDDDKNEHRLRKEWHSSYRVAKSNGTTEVS